MKRWISLGFKGFFGFILFWPTLLFAQEKDQLILAPSNSDLSYNYLSNIFGTVDGVLYGTGSQLLGTLFGVYNSAILIMGGIVILYTFFMGTLKTAHEGEVLGKEWSSVWIPLRTVAGITLLIPKATGYSFIQIFMMWVITQGIGVADSVWNAALNYLSRDGIIISKNLSGAGGNNNVAPFPMVKASSTLLRSLTCMEMLQRQLTLYRDAQIKKGISAINPVPLFYSDILAALSTPTNTIQFPQSGYYNTNGVCGSVTWRDVYTDFPKALKDDPEFDTYKNDKTRTAAVKAAIEALDSHAKTIADNYITRAVTPTLSTPLGQLVGSKWTGPNGPFLIPGTVLSNAAKAYYGKMSSIMQLIAKGASSPAATKQWIQPAKDKGWALAGAYYFDLVQANSKVSDIVDGNLPTVEEPAFDFTNEVRVTDVLGGKSSPYVVQLQTLVNGPNPSTGNSNPGATNDFIVSMSSVFITGAISYGAGVSYGASDASTPGQTGQMSAPASGASSSVGGFLGGLGDSENSNANPVVEIAKFGNSLVVISFVALLLMAIIGFAATIGLGCIPFCSVGAAGAALVVALTNLFTPIFVSLMTVGLTMSYYIPMIPFIIFSFGVIGWFIAVAEAMLAAPIVALGISHPEGSHAILGKADPAVGLMVNVFLRPTLMIFGLLVGMMLSYVGIWLLNQGFGQAFAGATAKSGGGASGIFKPIACIVIYTMIAIQILQKSFSLIHVIPDQIFRWIGINIQSMGGEAESEGAVSAGVKKGMSEQASRAGGAAKAGTEMGSGIGKARQQARESKAQESGGVGKDSGGEGGGNKQDEGGGGSKAQPPSGDGAI